MRVEGDVLDEVVDALGEGTGDRVHHLAERISVIGVRQWLVGVSVLPVFLIGVAVTCEFT
jgi:hypothetical protein